MLKIYHFRILLLFFCMCAFLGAYSQNELASINYKTEKDILYKDISKEQDEYAFERCRLDIYYPVNTDSFTTVVWFHGGGLVHGNKSFPSKLKGKEIAIIAVNYRLNPKVKCPVYLDDAAAAVAWVFKNIEKFGGSSNKIVVSGHSAGGYLTSMIGLDKRWLANYGIDSDKIAKLVPFSGHGITHMTVRKELGIPGGQPVVDEYAPLFHVRKSPVPLILITGDRNLEILGRYEENVYLWRMMKIAGNDKTKLYELDSFNHDRMASPAFDILLEEIKSLDKR